MNKKNVFFLGGKDLEMIEIKKMLLEKGVEFFDNSLGWGAKASAYAEEIAAVAAAGKVPVIVELVVDIDLPKGTINIDHHNERSGEPQSILQVCQLVGVEPTKWQILVATNDSGFIPGLVALGATPSEVVAIRKADREAQGIISEQEVEAERAVSVCEQFGMLKVARMSHSKCASVYDRLHTAGGGPGYDQLLMLSGDGEVNYLGTGVMCQKLKDKFEGWNGGPGLGESTEGNLCFWGGYPNQEEVLSFIKNELGV